MMALLLVLGLGVAKYYGVFDYPSSDISIEMSDLSEYYNTTQINTILEGYYNISSTYNITEITNLFLIYYNITEVDTIFGSYYNKTEIDTLLNSYSFTNHTHSYDYSDFANHTDIPPSTYYLLNNTNFSDFQNKSYITCHIITSVAGNSWVTHGLPSTPVYCHAEYIGTAALTINVQAYNSTKFQLYTFWTNGTAYTGTVNTIMWFAIYEL